MQHQLYFNRCSHWITPVCINLPAEFVRDQEVGCFASEIGPSSLFAAYQFIKTQEEKVADRSVIVKELIQPYPDIKAKLIERNKIFANLDNPVVFNTVGKFARIADIAQVSGENIDDLFE